jgi:SAM-dependent methyltransferase
VSTGAADPALAALVEAASAPYRAAGPFALRFARAKLAADPVFAMVLVQGLLGGCARILDLGCGQGLLAAWLLAAHEAAAAGRWPAGWPPAPQPESLTGVELDPREVRRARLALGARAQIVAGDIRDVDYPPADAIVMLDVLHYNDYAAQEAVLGRARRALAPRGRLLLRVGDAGSGPAFRLSAAIDRAVALVRRGPPARLWCRPAREWRSLLEGAGFASRAQPLRGRTFSNVLLVGEPA